MLISAGLEWSLKPLLTGVLPSGLHALRSTEHMEINRFSLTTEGKTAVSVVCPFQLQCYNTQQNRIE